MRLRSTLALPAVATLLTAHPLCAQAVVGRVTARTSHRPLSGVPVVLVTTDLDTVVSVRSDPDGRYVLRPGRAGTFLVVVDEPGFAAHLSNPVELRAAELYDHPVSLARLTAPSAAEPELQLRAVDVARACGRAFDPDRHGIVVGQVHDPGTGTSLTDVWVSARKTGASRPWEAQTGADGLYLLCDLPDGADVRLAAAGGGVSGPERQVTIAAGTVRRLDLELPLAEPGMGKILGRVVDVLSGQAVDGAEIHVRETGQWVLTDRNGNFALDSVAAGLHRIQVKRIGYATREVTFRVEPGGAHGLRVPMSTEAIALDPVVVTVRSPRWAREMRSLQHRMRTTGGAFFAREELERLAPRSLLDLVRDVPGITLIAADLRQPPLLRIRGRRCRPELVVDRVPRRDAAPWTFLRTVDMEAVEVYRGAAENPGAYGTGGACGAVLVWTRAGWS